jgi:hypothetical protein
MERLPILLPGCLQVLRGPADMPVGFVEDEGDLAGVLLAHLEAPDFQLEGVGDFLEPRARLHHFLQRVATACVASPLLTRGSRRAGRKEANLVGPPSHTSWTAGAGRKHERRLCATPLVYGVTPSTRSICCSSERDNDVGKDVDARPLHPFTTG